MILNYPYFFYHLKKRILVLMIRNHPYFHHLKKSIFVQD